MVRMIPSEYSDMNKSEAEKHLYYKLSESFGEDWTIFHSYSIEGRNKSNKIIDVEIDFLLINKELGILVLEVKGGQIKCEAGNWYQNSQPMKDPYKQALNNKYAIKNYLKKYFNAEPPFAIGHSVCFPDSFLPSEDISSTHKDITLTGLNLNYISESLYNIMKNQKSIDYKIDSKMFKTLEKAFSIVFDYGCSIADKFGLEERKVFSLTEQQCEFLIFISEHKKVLVKGCAGSGKTVMAVKKAKQLASQGKKVLLLCYNVMLSENLAFETKDYPNITAKTFHNFCGFEIDKAGLETGPAATTADFFQRELPEKFMELLEKHSIKFDAVIVDEGQDFKEDYWISISELVKEDGHFYVFYDPDQNIFKSDLKLPDLGDPFLLNKNCRNTKKIFNELKKFASMEIRISDEAPEGTDIILCELKDKSQLRNKLSQILHNLISNQNLKEKQIVILGTHRLNNTSLGGDRSIGKFTIVENGFADTNTVPYYTCMKYKGLEADVIILLDYEDERWENDAVKYTAISRAKHMLYILKVIK
ncbi:MAG: NERD domain-containing protein [Ignavibacteriaceae bacterium]